MAVWKKLNTETGLYEEIPNASSGGMLSSKITIGVEDAYTTYPMSDVATSASVGASMTIYTVENLVKGDIIKTRRQYNGQGNIIIDGDGNNLTNIIVWKEYVNGTLTLDQDYPMLKVQCANEYTSAASVSVREGYLKSRPAYGGEYVPTISDGERSSLKTLSSKKIRTDYGMDVIKAKEQLSGGVWIALGDSYTVYADGCFRALAEKYGMIYDGQGKTSSTVCGDNTGSKGFSPFWSRMDGFIRNYTGDGQTIDDKVYTADDVKLITFMGGANDGHGGDTWIGKPNSKDTNYICGSCNYIFGKLCESFPNARIIVILQPANYNQTVSSITTDEGAVTVGFSNLAELQTHTDYEYSQYAMVRKEKAIKECAEKYGLTVVDCIFDWYNVINPVHRATYWNSDKIHLSSAGSQALSDKLDKDGILKIFGG